MTFSLSYAYFGGYFYSHCNRYSQINMKYIYLGHSSDKTIQRKCCKITFNFWKEEAKTLPYARSCLIILIYEIEWAGEQTFDCTEGVEQQRY